MSVRDFDRRAQRVEALIGSINQPRAVAPDRPLEFWTTGERRRKIEELEAESAADAARLGIDPPVALADDAAIAAEAERDLRELAELLKVSPDDEAAVYRAAARRCEALGEPELAATWRRWAVEAAPKVAP